MKTSTIVAILIVVLLIIAGMWYMRTNQPNPTPISEGETGQSAAVAPSLEEQEVDALSTETNLEAEFKSIDSDLNQL